MHACMQDLVPTQLVAMYLASELLRDFSHDSPLGSTQKEYVELMLS